MPGSISTLSLLNLGIQISLVLAVLFAAYFAHWKMNFKTHCTILRVAVPLQILALAGVMLPSMLGYIEHVKSPLIFNLEMYVHHTLGLIVIGLWIYINLLLLGIIRPVGRLFITMRIAFVSWMLTFALGLHMYIVIVTPR